MAVQLRPSCKTDRLDRGTAEGGALRGGEGRGGRWRFEWRGILFVIRGSCALGARRLCILRSCPIPWKKRAGPSFHFANSFKHSPLLGQKRGEEGETEADGGPRRTLDSKRHATRRIAPLKLLRHLPRPPKRTKDRTHTIAEWAARRLQRYRRKELW